MSNLSPEAKRFIKTHSIENIGIGGLSALLAETLNASIETKFTPEERRQIVATIQKAYYINEILVWKIWALIGERRWAQAEFKTLCDKWEWAENIVNAYNNGIEHKDAPTFTAIDMVEAAADNFAPLTKFKAGKVQLQNKHIQRQFEKLRSRHADRLNFHYLIAYELDAYIQVNGLSDYIKEDIKNYIETLYNDLAHAPKFSLLEWEKEALLNPASEEVKAAKRYAVYPAPPNVVTANERDRNLAKYFLFNDLETAIRWTTTI